MVENRILTIITVVYNDVKSIRKTIESILNVKKKYSDVEYIIVDGGSQDGTLEIINVYRAEIDLLISESDSGIYDAMNKGISRATGVWILNMNCGDVLIELPIEDLRDSNNCNSYAAIAGSILNEKGVKYKSTFGFKMLFKNTLPHQGLFYNRTKMRDNYDVRYKVFADYHYNIKFYKQKQKVLIINNIIAIHDSSGVSFSSNSSNEFFLLLKNEFGVFVMAISYIYFKICGLKTRLRK